MSRFSISNGRRSGMRTLALLVSPLLLWLTGCNSDPVVQTLPRQMTGTYRTEEGKYQGRFMKLDGDKITFGLGGAGPDRTEIVQSVTMTPSDKPTDFTVKLKTAEGNPDSIILQFSEQTGELKLKSQPKIIWSRRVVPGRTQVAQTPGTAAAPGTAPLPAPKVGNLTPQQIYGEHMTIYKIDCLKPNACKSY